MNSWINLSALGQIVGVGLLCGAGLPALFALGLRSLSQPAHGEVTPADSEVIVAAGPLGVGVAVVCFAVVMAAVGWGIYFIVAGT